MTTYADLKEAVTTELERRILRILEQRVGADNAIKKSDALRYLPGVHERQFRLAVKNMQKGGMLIGSTNNDGYFLIGSLAEGELVASELEARATDLFETARIIRKRVKSEYGDAYQVTLL